MNDFICGAFVGFVVALLLVLRILVKAREQVERELAQQDAAQEQDAAREIDWLKQDAIRDMRQKWVERN